MINDDILIRYNQIRLDWKPNKKFYLGRIQFDRKSIIWARLAYKWFEGTTLIIVVSLISNI